MALVDTSINIECRATGMPPPQINWLKNGLPLPLSSHIRLLSGGQVIRSAFIMCDLLHRVTVIVNLNFGKVGKVGSLIKNLPARDARDMGSVPGLGRSPGGRNGNPLQYSCLENPMGRGVWWATVHGVARKLNTT